MTPKPLSKERREEIERDNNDLHMRLDDFAIEAIDDLIAAEAFWREAVKNGPAMKAYEDCCAYCHAPFKWSPDEDLPIPTTGHQPGCPYDLAQE